jgi:predicted ribosomally synthesized peptide with nif11-like leader
MALNKAQELIKKMATDAAFRSSIESAGSPEAKKAILTAAGFGDVTKADVEAAGKAAGAELTDAELEAVAGGRVVEWVGATAAVVGAGAAAAA